MLEATVKKVGASLSGNPATGALLGAVTSLIALLAAFGGADVARRNHQALLYIALVLVLAALSLGAVSVVVDGDWAKALAILGIVVLVAGLGLAGWAALDHQAGRPLVDASLVAGHPSHIEATIMRDGLGQGDQMFAVVDAFTNTTGDGTAAVLYRASFGPNEAGQIDYRFQLPVPTASVYKSILVETWVASLKHAASVSCNAASAPRVAKFQAACALIVLP